MELGAGEDGGSAGLGHGDQEGAWGETGVGRAGHAVVGVDRRSPVGLTVRAVPAVVAARPGWGPGAGTVVPGPALRVVPQAQARLKVRDRVVACGVGEGFSGCQLGRPSARPPTTSSGWSAAAPPAHGRRVRPRPSRPHSRPLRRIAGGAPRRPCSGSGDAPGGSVPGELRWRRGSPSLRP